MICGLGNPGPRYEGNRHNVGFMTVDALARQEGIAVDRLQVRVAALRALSCCCHVRHCMHALIQAGGAQ